MNLSFFSLALFALLGLSPFAHAQVETLGDRLECQYENSNNTFVNLSTRFSWQIKGHILDGYASAEVACGHSETELQCRGFYFGRLENPVVFRMNLKTKKAKVNRFFGGTASLTCKSVSEN